MTKGPLRCRHKEEEDAKRTALSAKYLQPLCKSKGAVASPQEEMQRFRYQLLKFELSPQFHRSAKMCVLLLFVPAPHDTDRSSKCILVNVLVPGLCTSELVCTVTW